MIDECDSKLQKELLDYWNYDENVKTDYIFVDCKNRPSATLRNCDLMYNKLMKMGYKKFNLELYLYFPFLCLKSVENYSVFDSISLKFDSF